jgi:hypothetical protein
MLQDIARPILEHLVIPFHMQDFASFLPFLPKKNLPKSIDMSCFPRKINPNHPKSSQIIPNHIIYIFFNNCSTCFNFSPFSTPGVTPLLWFHQAKPPGRPRLCRGSRARSSAGAAWKGPTTRRPTGRRSPGDIRDGNGDQIWDLMGLMGPIGEGWFCLILFEFRTEHLDICM